MNTPQMGNSMLIVGEFSTSQMTVLSIKTTSVGFFPFYSMF
jgi:hypothetical protein